MTPLTRDQKLAAIRAKCVEAQPDLLSDIQHAAFDMPPYLKHEPRLADVLLAIGIDGMDLGCALDDDGCVTCHPDVAKVLNLLTLWDYSRTDSLNDLDDAGLTWLHSLLCL